jgi:Na+/melibiose symporter-like transporter
LASTLMMAAFFFSNHACNCIRCSLQWTSRYGRRRPFIAFGLAINVVGIVCAGCGPLLLAAPYAKVAAVVLGYFLSMCGTNTMTGPVRALIGVSLASAQGCPFDLLPKTL